MPGPEFDPATLAGLRRQIEQLQRQVNDLATRAPLRSGSISDDDGNIVLRLNGSGIALHDPDQNLRAAFGRLYVDTWGVAALTEDGEVFALFGDDQVLFRSGNGDIMLDLYAADNGFRRPAWSSGWVRREAGDQRAATSASWETAWSSGVGAIYHDVASLAVDVFAEPGTAGEIRIREVTTGASTSVKSIPANTNTRWRCDWLHGTQLDIADREVVIEIRRTSGAGVVSCRPGSEVRWWSSAVLPSATAAGWVS